MKWLFHADSQCHNWT